MILDAIGRIGRSNHDDRPKDQPLKFDIGGNRIGRKRQKQVQHQSQSRVTRCCRIGADRVGGISACSLCCTPSRIGEKLGHWQHRLHKRPAKHEKPQPQCNGKRSGKSSIAFLRNGHGGGHRAEEKAKACAHHHHVMRASGENLVRQKKQDDKGCRRLFQPERHEYPCVPGVRRSAAAPGSRHRGKCRCRHRQDHSAPHRFHPRGGSEPCRDPRDRNSRPQAPLQSKATCPA